MAPKARSLFRFNDDGDELSRRKMTSEGNYLAREDKKNVTRRFRKRRIASGFCSLSILLFAANWRGF